MRTPLNQFRQLENGRKLQEKIAYYYYTQPFFKTFSFYCLTLIIETKSHKQKGIVIGIHSRTHSEHFKSYYPCECKEVT